MPSYSYLGSVRYTCIFVYSIFWNFYLLSRAATVVATLNSHHFWKSELGISSQELRKCMASGKNAELGQ